MNTVATSWFTGFTGSVETIAIGLLFLLNGAYVLNLVLRRSYRFVDRWTKPLLLADATLVIAAVGTPVVALALKIAARGVSSVVTAVTGVMASK